jgi:hypothetical protein
MKKACSINNADCWTRRKHARQVMQVLGQEKKLAVHITQIAGQEACATSNAGSGQEESLQYK